jgi:hypothetical protein
MAMFQITGHSIQCNYVIEEGYYYISPIHIVYCFTFGNNYIIFENGKILRNCLCEILKWREKYFLMQKINLGTGANCVDCMYSFVSDMS